MKFVIIIEGDWIVLKQGRQQRFFETSKALGAYLAKLVSKQLAPAGDQADSE